MHCTSNLHSCVRIEIHNSVLQIVIRIAIRILYNMYMFISQRIVRIDFLFANNICLYNLQLCIAMIMFHEFVL